MYSLEKSSKKKPTFVKGTESKTRILTPPLLGVRPKFGVACGDGAGGAEGTAACMASSYEGGGAVGVSPPAPGGASVPGAGAGDGSRCVRSSACPGGMSRSELRRRDGGLEV